MISNYNKALANTGYDPPTLYLTLPYKDDLANVNKHVAFAMWHFLTPLIMFLKLNLLTI